MNKTFIKKTQFFDPRGGIVGNRNSESKGESL